jgi:hypothetical protein
MAKPEKKAVSKLEATADFVLMPAPILRKKEDVPNVLDRIEDWLHMAQMLPRMPGVAHIVRDGVLHDAAQGLSVVSAFVRGTSIRVIEEVDEEIRDAVLKLLGGALGAGGVPGMVDSHAIDDEDAAFLLRAVTRNEIKWPFIERAKVME